MPISIVNSTVYIQACCTFLPFVTPPVTLPRCQCPMDLYSDSLCPKYGPCNRDPRAVTYGFPPMCPVVLNCKGTDYIRFQFSDGTYVNNGCQLQMPISIVDSTVYIQACCTILPFVTPPVAPPTPPTPSQCKCAMDLYSDSLCPTNGPCNRDPAAVTYGFSPLCPVTLNCDQTDYVRFQFSDGTLNNIRVSDFRQRSDIQCVKGEWRYYGQAAFDKTLRHIVCYSIAIPYEH